MSAAVPPTTACVVPDAGQAILPAVARTVTVIQPRRGWAALDPRTLWRHRDLGWVLALRDLRVRYKQSLLGAGWAIIQPLASMIVLHVFFGHALGMAQRVGDVPYPVFLYAGLLPWTFFTAAVTASSNSFVGNAHILSKVYFPRLLLPVSAALPPVLDYAIAALVLLGLMLWFEVAIGWSLLLLIPLLLSTLVVVLGVGILMASLTVSFRDVRHALPLTLQLWFFMTPVIYPVTLLPPRYQWLLQLNPMSGLIEAYRAAVLGGPIDYAAWGTSLLVALAVLVAGLAWFSRVERRFADIV